MISLVKAQAKTDGLADIVEYWMMRFPLITIKIDRHPWSIYGWRMLGIWEN